MVYVNEKGYFLIGLSKQIVARQLIFMAPAGIAVMNMGQRCCCRFNLVPGKDGEKKERMYAVGE